MKDKEKAAEREKEKHALAEKQLAEILAKAPLERTPQEFEKALKLSKELEAWRIRHSLNW